MLSVTGSLFFQHWLHINKESQSVRKIEHGMGGDNALDRNSLNKVFVHRFLVSVRFLGIVFFIFPIWVIKESSHLNQHSMFSLASDHCYSDFVAFYWFNLKSRAYSANFGSQRTNLWTAKSIPLFVKLTIISTTVISILNYPWHSPHLDPKLQWSQYKLRYSVL